MRAGLVLAALGWLTLLAAPGAAQSPPVPPVAPVAPVEPVEPAEPVEPVKPVEPVEPAKPVTPVIRDIRVHGNHTTPDADVLAIAAVVVGEPATDALLRDAERRLRASGRFAGAEVRRRFRSLDDPSDVLVLVLVEEWPATTENDLTPGAWKRLTRAGMWLPVLGYEDGYGFTYGARVTLVDALGPQSRVSAPLTWGGDRRIAVEAQRVFAHGPFTRVEGAAALGRRVNPYFALPDTRRDIGARGERALMPWLRAGAGARVAHVSFGGDDSRVTSAGADLVVDTRRDPAFPRDAVHAVIGWEHLWFEGGRSAGRWSTDVEGFVGMGRHAVLAVRAVSTRASEPLPPYEWQLLGGATSLRGYRAGHRAGDNLALVSAELRVPLTSPLSLGRAGAKVFVDAGAAYASRTSWRDAAFERGIGGGLFAGATVLSAALDVAWSEAGKARLHAAIGVRF